jgi:ABC-type antimicrobial peptide transport system ATPase subunit
MALLEIENLSVQFPSKTGVMHAVDGVSLSLEAGATCPATAPVQRRVSSPPATRYF